MGKDQIALFGLVLGHSSRIIRYRPVSPSPCSRFTETLHWDVSLHLLTIPVTIKVEALGCGCQLCCCAYFEVCFICYPFSALPPPSQSFLLYSHRRVNLFFFIGCCKGRKARCSTFEEGNEGTLPR